MKKEEVYLCIDLKSFYASVECVERGLDPMKTNLVVADPERTEKTICLAVSPSMKALGVPGRCRVFEIPKGMNYIMAPPRMQRYIQYASEIYGIYLKYFAKEDIHVYSIDEAFVDATNYLELYQMTARELSRTVMEDILKSTGITATCGIGTNLYLAKIALDITAKHVKDHIGMLNEETYRQMLWNHKPLTDFWRVGKGIARRLEHVGIRTMGELAKADERLVYRLFGIDAELLIDHAWGRETTTIADIKAYRPKNHSISSGQVLPEDYSYEEGQLIIKEMTDLLALELVDKKQVTDSITLHIGYNNRVEEKSAHGTMAMTVTTNSAKQLMEASSRLYEQIINPNISIRRVYLTFNHVQDESYRQYDLFTNQAEVEREHKVQKAMLAIKNRYGKNAILKGMNLQENATTRARNAQIGGHKSGV